VPKEPAKQQDRLVVRDPHRDANRLSWPPLRSDLVAAACLGVLVYCLVEQRWPALAIAALFGLIFAGLSPRMKGPFGLQSGSARLGGEFDDPFEGLTPADFGEPMELGPPPESPPKTEPVED
jgi:hypothetical protein